MKPINSHNYSIYFKKSGYNKLNELILENKYSYVFVLVDENTEICACAERIFAASMDGNCMSPIGAYAEINNNEIRLTGFVSKLDGTKYIKNHLIL